MILPFVQTGPNEIYYQGRKYRSMKAAELAEAEFIRKAEKAAGRPLTAKELVQGIPHPEDRSRQQQISDQAFHVEIHTEQQPDTLHPFDSAQSSLDNRRDSRAALTERMRAAYDARIAGQQPPADAARRQAAIEHAHELLHSVLYSPAVPQSIVERAKQLVAIAQRTPNLDQYKADSQELIVRIADHKRAVSTAIELKRAEALADLPQQFEPVEPMPEKPKPVAPYSWDEIKAEPDPRKRHQMWTENESIKAEAENA